MEPGGRARVTAHLDPLGLGERLADVAGRGRRESPVGLGAGGSGRSARSIWPDALNMPVTIVTGFLGARLDYAGRRGAGWGELRRDELVHLIFDQLAVHDPRLFG